MAEQENCVPTTRSSSKRRASVSEPPQHLFTIKKRAVLGELNTNSLSLQSTQNPNPLSPKSKLKCKQGKLTTNDSTQDSGAESQKPRRKQNDKEENNQDFPIHESPISAHIWPITESTQNSDKDDDSQKYTSIYQHLHLLEIEGKRRPLANYVKEVQNHISAQMREILVDWLVEVADDYKLVSDTLYLTIAYIDRFLSSNALSKSKLQLLGVSCLLIASKYEEISPPHIEDLCYITDNTYTKEEVVDMEKEVLQFLKFEISTPTTKNFLRIFASAAQENCKFPDLQFEFLSCYLAELSLLDYGCVRFLPSVIAASAIFVAKFTIQPKKFPWSKTLQFYSGYTPSDLKECVLSIHDLQLNRRASSSRAVRERYMQHKFKCVATLSSPLDIPTRYFEAIEE